MIRPTPTPTLFPYTTLFRSAPVKLEREVWDLSAVWRQAWENLALQRKGRDATMTEHTGGVDLHIAVDQFRLNQDRKSTRLNSSHVEISYAVFCLKKKNKKQV